ncbi:MAG: PrsW family glutamic-type intramembrane protease [Spirochaetales bacterium]
MELLVLLGLSVASGGLVLSFLKRLDRHRSDKGGQTFVWIFVAAGALSVLPSLGLYQLSPLWFQRSSGETWQQILYIWLVNAPVEELGKYLTFALVATLLKTIREPQDGSLQGAQVGLGFALVENFLYGLSGGWPLLLLRAFVSLPGHMVYGAVWGGYHGYEVYHGKGKVLRWSTPALALVPAVFSHALFNTLATVGVGLEFNLLADAATLGFGIFLYSRLTAVSPYRSRRPWKDWARAIPELEHALVVNPQSFLLRQRLAGYLLASGDGEAALQQLEVAESLAPGDRWTEFYREAARIRVGNGRGGANRDSETPEVAALNPGLFKALSGR